jgi:hypothetical protein
MHCNQLLGFLRRALVGYNRAGIRLGLPTPEIILLFVFEGTLRRVNGFWTSDSLGMQYALLARDPRGLTELRFGVCPGRHLADLPLCAEGSYRR